MVSSVRLEKRSGNRQAGHPDRLAPQRFPTFLALRHGRPSLWGEISELIVRIAKENLTWRQKRVAAELISSWAFWCLLRAQLFTQDSVLFSRVVDELQLLLVHPAGRCDQQESERGQGFCHEESNIITPPQGNPGDLLQIYADRVSGHYGVIVCGRGF